MGKVQSSLLGTFFKHNTSWTKHCVWLCSWLTGKVISSRVGKDSSRNLATDLTLRGIYPDPRCARRIQLPVLVATTYWPMDLRLNVSEHRLNYNIITEMILLPRVLPFVPRSYSPARTSPGWIQPLVFLMPVARPSSNRNSWQLAAPGLSALHGRPVGSLATLLSYSVEWPTQACRSPFQPLTLPLPSYSQLMILIHRGRRNALTLFTASTSVVVPSKASCLPMLWSPPLTLSSIFQLLFSMISF